jgi:hypothetical protein
MSLILSRNASYINNTRIGVLSLYLSEELWLVNGRKNNFMDMEDFYAFPVDI